MSKKSEGRLIDLFSHLSGDLSRARETDIPVRFAVDRFFNRHRKRARISALDVKNVAIDGFFAANRNVATKRSEINLDPFIIHNARLFITESFERYNSKRDEELIQIPYDPRVLHEFWRFGPGASNGVQGTHTAQKLIQPFTCTVLAKPAVSLLRQSNPYLASFDRKNNNDGLSLVAGSRLTTVPKNEETDRTIAIEPSGNMLLQLAVGEYITDVLRSIGLDINCQQPLNKALAKQGSIDGSFATIDLKSASDMISIPLARLLLPDALFNALMRFRSSWTEIDGHGLVKLNMLSTMGNGFTFPIMTLIFTSLVYANRLSLGGPSKYIDWKRTAVFGDDIIVPSAEALSLIKVLEGAGFIVNHDKSFLDGPFRESCGGDFYEGYDVTPVYIKSLSHESEIYVAINGLMSWSARHNVLLFDSISYLFGLIDRPKLVPEWENPDQGILTTLVKRRYKHLMLMQSYKRTECPHFDMMLACGGFITSLGPHNVYLPRPFKTRYRVRKSRLPKGYLDGRAPERVARPESDRIRSYTELLVALHEVDA